MPCSDGGPTREEQDEEASAHAGRNAALCWAINQLELAGVPLGPLEGWAAAHKRVDTATKERKEAVRLVNACKELFKEKDRYFHSSHPSAQQLRVANDLKVSAAKAQFRIELVLADHFGVRIK